MRLAGKVAIVTGAARGIGLAIAQWFDARGWRVALLDVDEEQLRRTHAQWPRHERALALHADVSSPGQVADAVRRTEAAFGRIDALVNNAGVAVFKPMLQTSFDEWRRVMATNLDGAFLCTQAVLPAMRAKQWGRIVNISSGAARGAGAIGPHYNASKAGVEGLTRGYAARLVKEGITVNTVAPGFVPVERHAEVTDEVRRAYVASVPAGRFGTGEDIAHAVSFFASEAAVRVTNDALQIHGAMGYSRNLALERKVRDARMFPIAGGTAQILRTQVAGAILGIRTPQSRDGYLKLGARE